MVYYSTKTINLMNELKNIEISTSFGRRDKSKQIKKLKREIKVSKFSDVILRNPIVCILLFIIIAQTTYIAYGEIQKNNFSNNLRNDMLISESIRVRVLDIFNNSFN